ncbi:uncharacterized protein F54H12.2-like [Lepisosteus oculatus]|uniref:uncharacterized protein F54H12.2-like n=1 Tax=Lepisosteus oculatus TaxID=7918 RepID=UPI0035F51B90
MAFVHGGSAECAKSELDIFQLAPTQTSVEKSFYIEVPPLTALTENAPLEFYVAGNGEDYLDLNNTLLYLTCKITEADGRDIDAAARVSLVNYPIAAIFSQVDITVGDRLISQSNNCYPYRAFIESVLNYSEETLKTQYSTGLFYKDTAGEHESTILDGPNQGFRKRASYTTQSRKLELLGHIHADLFFQDKLLLNGLPKVVILGFVDNAAFSGSFTQNPFNFKHYNVNFLALYADGEQIPTKPLQPDFQNGHCVREYFNLVETAGKRLKDKPVLVDREEYARGYTLFAFNLSPDDECTGHYSLIKSGNLRAEIRFATPLPTTVNMVVYALFDNVIELDMRRQVIYDFS